MTIPNIDDWTESLDQTCRDYLYEAIQYKADGASTYATKKANVDYRDQSQAFQGAEVVTQDIHVSLLKADVPAKPNGNVRITLSKRTGRYFKPVNVGSDGAGTHWEFELKDVISG